MSLKCHLREIPKNSLSNNLESAERKAGRYLKSMFPQVKGYGDTKWVIGCYVEVDEQKEAEKLSEPDLVRECLEYLNEIPPREKFQRKPTSPLYGKLELLSYKIKEDAGRAFIEMLLITDDQKNENFWGEGISFAKVKPRKRRSKEN